MNKMGKWSAPLEWPTGKAGVKTKEQRLQSGKETETNEQRTFSSRANKCKQTKDRVKEQRRRD